MSAYPHKGIAWSQKEKSRAASRPQPNKNHISYIPQSLRGLRYFFVRQTFFFSPGLTHHQAKTNSRAHAPFGVCAFTLSVNAVFWYFPVGQKRLETYIGRLEEKHIRRIDHALAVSVGLIEEVPENLIMCLCPACANNFYGTGSYYLRRVNPAQQKRDICTYCSQRPGFDYEVVKRAERR